MRYICSLSGYQNCFRFVIVHLKFVAYQDLTSHMHFSMLWMVALISDGLLELYNWVSSAYSWCDTGCLPITHEKGWVYMMKRIGPRTEP